MTEARRRSVARELSSVFRVVVAAVAAMVLAVGGMLGYSLGVLDPGRAAAQSVVAAALDLHSDFLTEQSDVRAFLVTGEPELPGAFAAARSAAAGDLQRASRSASAGLVANVAQLRAADAAWLQAWATPNTARGARTALLSRGGHLVSSRVRDRVRAGDVPAQRVLAAQHALLAGAEGVLSTADDRFRDMLVASVALLTLCGTLAVGLAARRSRRWTGLFVVPVRQLLDSVQAVARGQFKVHAVDDGLAEIVELSDGLADMATSLRLQQRALATRAEQADRSAERLRRVLGFARDVSASLTLPYVLDAIGNAARALTGTGRARLWLLDDEQGQLTLAHDTGGDSPPGAPVTVPLGAGAVGRATRFGQVSHAQHADEAGPAGAVGRHTVAVPLVASGRAIGALEIGWDSEDKLDDEILEVLEAVAGHGAVAIEAARSYERTENLSLSDPLTGLANRRRLEQDLSLETQRAGRYGRSLAFLMIDVDHFKRVNDVHGHVVGDRVLQQLANLLSEEARSVDSVYRYGGEELAVIARETDLLGAGRLAERLRRVVEHTFRGAATPVTISIGVATMPEQAATVEELLHAADEALYRAKREGRNRVVLAEGLSDPSLPELPQVPMGL